MASPIEAVLLLCDAAQADPFGKLHMLGAGWSITSSPTAPCAVAVLLKIPWDRSNQQIPTSLTLADADGSPVVLPDVGVLRAESVVEVGRPPGLAHGSMIDASFQLSVGSLPLQPGRYQWRLDVGDQNFTVAFQVRAT